VLAFSEGNFGTEQKSTNGTGTTVVQYPVASNVSAINFSVVSNGAVYFAGESGAPGSSCSGDNSANFNTTTKAYYATFTCLFPKPGNYWVTFNSYTGKNYVVKVTATAVVCTNGKIGDSCQYSNKKMSFEY
jgi:hypothetical protein